MRVLVGCPTSDIFEYCLNEFLERIKNLSYNSYDILIIDNSKDDNYLNLIKEKIKNNKKINAVKGPYFEDWRQRVVHSRNLIIDYTIKNNYDYLLSVDQDVILPKDVIEKLLKFNKEIISGVYYGFFLIDGVKKLRPLLYKYRDNKKYNLELNEVENESLIRVDECGAGCLLIKRNVLEKGIKFGLLEDPKTTDDVYFCQKATEAGFEIFAYTGVKAKHMVLGRKRPYDE